MVDMNRSGKSSCSLLEAGQEQIFDTRMGIHIFDSFVPIFSA